jgi:hypothetical protein
MAKYREVSYYTLSGIRKFIDLGDQSYGEWIVCENNVPKYHIIAFQGNGESNALIANLISAKNESIETIMEKISKNQHIKLSFQGRPYFEFVKKSELVELDLVPLPCEWVKQLIK